MQRILTIPLALMLLIALLYGYALGAEKSKGETKKTQTSKQQQPPSETKPIEKNEVNQVDLTWTSFPKNYTGHDLKSIYEALEKRKKIAQKDEYETTEQYQKRVQDEERKPLLIGKLGINDILSFVVTPKLKYNADSQKLTLTVKARNGIWTDQSKIDNLRSAIVGPTLYSDTSTYMASNAYGASTEVTKLREVQVELAFSNKSALPLKISENGGAIFEFELENISPEIAKTIKEQLQVAFIYTLEKPYFSTGSFVRTPSRQTPEDTISVMHHVLATSKAA